MATLVTELMIGDQALLSTVGDDLWLEKDSKPSAGCPKAVSGTEVLTTLEVCGRSTCVRSREASPARLRARVSLAEWTLLLVGLAVLVEVLLFVQLR